MYPNLYYVFRDLFGIRIGMLRFINTFGFFVALAFLAAAALLARELRRKGTQGLLQPTDSKHVVGKPASAMDILLNALVGFLFGYKIVALFFLPAEATQDTQAYIFSGAGSWPAGLLLGGLFGWFKWREGKKQQLVKPEERTVRIWPHDRVGEITMIALIVGLVGAKLFDIFENWSGFLEQPAAYLLSGGGLTFYGGLICATLAIVLYARKNKISVPHLADSIAPALMIAYAIGRIGCQVAGDGDWGIYNTAFKVSPESRVVAAAPNEFEDTVQTNSLYFLREYEDLGQVDQARFEKPGFLGFLPDWMFAYHYPHNVNETGVSIPGCTERYCKQLPAPVFPTPFYETLMGTLLFALLWGIRKRIMLPGALFCLYLVVNGAERFLIEQIRVNKKMNFLGMQPTQAEVIAVGLMLAGLAGYFLLRTKYRASRQKV
jgi:phosphatidylglycerol:prolipoprotein diacylglycerol transferase